jgi:hypothetical protein
MKIPEVGRERDKMSDELRDYFKQCCNNLIMEGYCQKEQKINLINAWELWDKLCKELPSALEKFSGLHYYFSSTGHHLITINVGNEEKINCTGTSFPDAVSKAWIEWKSKC